MKRVLGRVVVGLVVAASVVAIGGAADRVFAVDGDEFLRCSAWGRGATLASNSAMVCSIKAGTAFDTTAAGLYVNTSPFTQHQIPICYTSTAEYCMSKWSDSSVGRTWVGPTSSPFGEVPDGYLFSIADNGDGGSHPQIAGYRAFPWTGSYSPGWRDGTSTLGSVWLSWRSGQPYDCGNCSGWSQRGELNAWLGVHGDTGAVDWLTDNAYWPPAFPGMPAPPVGIRSCDEIGISYRTKDVGSSSFASVTLGSWPALSFGALIEWTMELDPDEQVDHLVFSMIGATPLSYTGDPPNWSPGQLQPFALDLLDSEFLANDGFMSGVGIGAQWEIRPGDAQAVQIGPATLTGSFVWLGHNGTRPAFGVECRSVGSGVTVFDQDATAYGGTTLSVPACDSFRVVPWEPAGSDSAWGFRFSKVASTTAFVSLEWRTGDEAWVSVYAPSPATADELVYLFSISKASLVSPELAEWRCTGVKPGGGTVTRVRGTDVNTSESSDYGRAGQDEGCYARATGSMELTSPKSWIVGGGRIGTCLVEWLVVPSRGKLSSEYDVFQDELEVQTPFSFLFIMDGFLSDLEDTVTDMEAGDAPDIPIASFTIGGATVDTSGYAPGAVVGDAVEPADRSLLTLLLLGAVVWGVLHHAAALLFERSPVSDDDPRPTNFGGSGR